MKLLPRAIANALGTPSTGLASWPGWLGTVASLGNPEAHSERERDPRAACLHLRASQEGRASGQRADLRRFPCEFWRFSVKATVGHGRREGPRGCGAVSQGRQGRGAPARTSAPSAARAESGGHSASERVTATEGRWTRSPRCERGTPLAAAPPADSGNVAGVAGVAGVPTKTRKSELRETPHVRPAATS